MNKRFSSRAHFIILIGLVQLLGLWACFRKDPVVEKPVDPAAGKVVVLLPEKKLPLKDQQLQRLARYLEQADAVHREAWWVVANERKVQGKSIFGKAQRALLTELNIKLGNKNLFNCDRYLVKREISSALGLPQKGELMEKCSLKVDAIRFAEFELPNATEADVYFYPQHLAEVVGVATSILNRKVHCHFKGDEEGKLRQVSCQNLAQDRNSTQSIQFSVYDYEKDGKNLITLKGQVYENLSPVRKIVAQVPMQGKIEVTETQTEAPEVVVIPPAAPEKTATLPADGVPTAVERPNRRALSPGPDARAGAVAPGAGVVSPNANVQAARPVRPRGQPVAEPNGGEIVESQNPYSASEAHPENASSPGNAEGETVPNPEGESLANPEGPDGAPAAESGMDPNAEGDPNGPPPHLQANPQPHSYDRTDPRVNPNTPQGILYDPSLQQVPPPEPPQIPRSAPEPIHGR